MEGNLISLITRYIHVSSDMSRWVWCKYTHEYMPKAYCMQHKQVNTFRDQEYSHVFEKFSAKIIEQ